MRKRKRKHNKWYLDKLKFYYKDKIITKYYLQDEYPEDEKGLPTLLKGIKYHDYCSN